MIDISGKTIATSNDAESENLLRMAVAQGFSLPKGLKTLVGNRFFKFYGSPLMTVQVLEISENKEGKYSEMFGNEDDEMQRLLDSTLEWCVAHKYKHVSVHVNEENNTLYGKAFVSDVSGVSKKFESKAKAPIKVSMDDIEKMFGGPVEIVS